MTQLLGVYASLTKGLTRERFHNTSIKMELLYVEKSTTLDDNPTQMT